MVNPEALKVFVSYARSDCSAFADELVDGLEVAGFAPFLDRHDIAAGEDWENRLGDLIAAADTVAFVVSPGSVASERCGWEVAKAKELGKRIIPVVAIEVGADGTPPELARLNYVFFNRQPFPRALKELAAALRTDLGWMREHTRLGELAARRTSHGNSDALLLRGPELTAAQSWIANAAGGAEATVAQRAFIEASLDLARRETLTERERLDAVAREQAAKEAALQRLSRRTVLGLWGAGGLTALAGGLFWWGAIADAARKQAEQATLEAETAKEKAEEAAQEAEKNSIRARIDAEATRSDITGQLTGYASAAGDPAGDGTGDTGHSPYTAALQELLQDPDVSLLQALLMTNRRVNDKTRGTSLEQQPFLSTTLNGDIYLQHKSPTRKLKALVVSVTDAPGMDLHLNVGTDADSWQKLLEGWGFDTSRVENPSAPHLQESLIEASFASIADPTGEPAPDTLTFFYFAGPGFTENGEPQLVAYDPKFPVSDIEQATVSVRMVQQVLKMSRAAVIILDTGFPRRDTT